LAIGITLRSCSSAVHLTTSTPGTRIGRFLVQEVMGKINPNLAASIVGPAQFFHMLVVAAGPVCCGAANSNDLADVRNRQPVARGCCDERRDTILFNTGKSRYAAVTVAPADIYREHDADRPATR